MIVVCGDLAGRATRAAEVARMAAANGAVVQLVSVVPDEADMDRALTDLVGAGVGHAAVLREPARDLEAADVDLALRYLQEIRVIVVVKVPTPVIAAAADHAGWSGAALVIVTAASSGDGLPPPDLPEGAIVLESPASDPDGTFAGFVGAFAARLDGGALAADAWAATTRELAVDPV